jgi:hypothetical protein
VDSSRSERECLLELELSEQLKLVIRDIYLFKDDSSKDLAIVRVDSKSHTPLQKVVQGDRTIEGYLEGAGELKVVRTNGEEQVFTFPGKSNEEVSVLVGDTMQWCASKGEQLTFYEICTPPYKDGRFVNIEA